MSASPILRLRSCAVSDGRYSLLSDVDWELLPGEAWVVSGPNGGGKSAFASALAGRLRVLPAEGGEHRNDYAASAALVSFEEAASLIARERANDDSDFVEGGVDPGTSARAFIAEALPPASAAGFPGGAGLESHPAVLACGVGPVLDRGLSRLSTGEIRRTLLARALAADARLLLLDEPFEGLDAAARESLSSLLEALIVRGLAGDGPRVVLVLDRWERVPPSANRVAELAGRRFSFLGGRLDYEAVLAERRRADAGLEAERRERLLADLRAAEAESEGFAFSAPPAPGETLVEFRDVVVSYDERRVLDGLDWTVRAGEHWLVRGPNGSGKTTILELISGDNPQVFRNDVRLFGSRRGSGETIWDLKKRMGLVSYRLHVEYRFLDDCALEEVLVSGLRDSIGLYGGARDAELLLARRWLDLAGFGGRGGERFGALSYGEQRAVLVARGAVKGPALLILDEPCHGLDEAQRRRILDLIGAVADHGRSTLLYVTHDPAEIPPRIRRVLELRPGATPMWAAGSL